MRLRNYLVWGACLLALCGAGCDDEGQPGTGLEGSDGGQPGSGQDGGQPGSGQDGGQPGSGQDGGGDEGSALPSLETCLEGVAAKDTETELLTFRAAGLAVAVVRYVDPEGFGTSGTTVWLPERFAFAQGEFTACVTDANALTYVGSRHNFDDTLTAEAEGTTYVWTQQRDGYETLASWTVSATGARALASTPLTLVSCRVLNDDSDCGRRYGLTSPNDDDDGDGGDGDGPDEDVTGAFHACVDEAVSEGFRTELLTFEGTGLIAALVRYPDPDAFGTSGTTSWLVQRFALLREGVSLCVTDADALAYSASYHNFNDSLVITADDFVYTWTQTRDGYGSLTHFTLGATLGDRSVFGPVELTLVTCRDLGDDRDCKDYYLNL